MASVKHRKQKNVDVDEALRLQEIRCLVFPHSIAEQLARASLLMKKELHSQALQDFQAVLLKRPNCIDALLGIGLIDEKHGRFDQAIEQFSRVLALDSKNSKALYARGHCHNVQGSISKAVDDYALALKEDHGSEDLKRILLGKKGWRTFEKKAEDGSMKELKELSHQDDDVTAVNSDQQVAASLNDTGLIFISTPTMRYAKEEPAASDVQPPHASFTPPPFDTARAQASVDDRAREVDRLQSRGYAKRKEGDFSGAIRYYSRAIEIDKSNFKSFFYRGFAYHSSGDFARALKDYSAAIAIDKTNSFTYYNRGITRERISDLTGAIEDFSQAISLDPSSADSWHNRGYSHRRAGDLAAAIRDYSTAIKLNAKHSRALYNRAYCYDSMGKHSEAMLDYDLSISIDPSPSSYHSRGVLHQKLGNVEEALSDLTMAIRSHPPSSSSPGSLAATHQARGLLLSGLDMHDEAIHDYDQSIALLPSSSAYRSRAQCRKALGLDPSSIVEDLTRAIQLGDPNDASLLVSRGHAFRRMGEHEAALVDYSEALKKEGGDKVGVLNHRAYCYAKLGLFVQSVQDYDRVLSLDPSNSHAAYNRGFSLEQLGVIEEETEDEEGDV